MKLMSSLSSLFLLGAFLSTSAIAQDDPVEKTIKARQGYYKMVSFNAGPLFQMAKGKIDYDAELAATHASNLALLGNMNNGAMWPAGSDNTQYDTRALPEIWSTYPDIVEKVMAFKEATATIGKEAGNGLDALRSAVGSLGKSCKGCHDNFREE